MNCSCVDCNFRPAWTCNFLFGGGEGSALDNVPFGHEQMRALQLCQGTDTLDLVCASPTFVPGTDSSGHSPTAATAHFRDGKARAEAGGTAG